jgi:hypothetical protein
MTADVKILDERFQKNGHSRMRPGLFAALFKLFRLLPAQRPGAAQGARGWKAS